MNDYDFMKNKQNMPGVSVSKGYGNSLYLQLCCLRFCVIISCFVNVLVKMIMFLLCALILCFFEIRRRDVYPCALFFSLASLHSFESLNSLCTFCSFSHICADGR